ICAGLNELVAEDGWQASTAVPHVVRGIRRPVKDGPVRDSPPVVVELGVISHIVQMVREYGYRVVRKQYKVISVLSISWRMLRKCRLHCVSEIIIGDSPDVTR